MATNIDEIAEKLDGLTLLEAAQLSKLLQEKWGVSAAAAVAVAAPAAGGGAAAVMNSTLRPSGRRSSAVAPMMNCMMMGAPHICVTPCSLSAP